MSGRMMQRLAAVGIGAVVLALVVPLSVLSIAETDPGTAVLALAVLAIGAAVTVRLAALAARPATGSVGGRARAHRRMLTVEPAPQHPRTSGRRQARAPSGLPTAA